MENEELPLDRTYFIILVLEKVVTVLESEGKYSQAFDYAKQLLERRRLSNKELLEDESKKRIRAANIQAANLSSQGNYWEALNLLKRAEVLADSISDKEVRLSAKSYTYNSMACIYKQSNELKTAFKYINKAIELEKISKDKISIGSYYLNGSAILSLIGDHSEAKKYANCAIEYTNAEITISNSGVSNKKLKEKKAL